LTLARIIVALTAAAAFWQAGMAFGYRHLARHRQLREIRAALRALETEIVYGRSLLADACRRLADLSPGAGGSILAWMGQGLATSGLAGESWSGALEIAEVELALDAEDLRILGTLGTCLGQSDGVDQSAHLTMVREMLGEREAQAAEVARRNGRLWAYIGLLGGLALVLLIW